MVRTVWSLFATLPLVKAWSCPDKDGDKDPVKVLTTVEIYSGGRYNAKNETDHGEVFDVDMLLTKADHFEGVPDSMKKALRDVLVQEHNAYYRPSLEEDEENEFGKINKSPGEDIIDFYIERISAKSPNSKLAFTIHTCDPNLGPVMSYKLAKAVRDLFIPSEKDKETKDTDVEKSKDMLWNWSAVTSRRLKNDNLAMYFDMVGDPNERKRLVHSSKTDLSKADIWQIGGSAGKLYADQLAKEHYERYIEGQESKYDRKLRGKSGMSVDSNGNVKIIDYAVDDDLSTMDGSAAMDGSAITLDEFGNRKRILIDSTKNITSDGVNTIVPHRKGTVGSTTRLMLNNVVMSDSSDEHIYHELLIWPAMMIAMDGDIIDIGNDSMNYEASYAKKDDSFKTKDLTVLLIGGGEGASLREILKNPHVKHVTMVDLDKNLVELATTYLSMMHQSSFTDPRVKLLFEDGAEFVKTQPSNFYDIIYVDGTDPVDSDDRETYREPNYGNVLFTEEFYKQVIRILKPNGGILAQYRSSLDEKNYEENMIEKFGFSETIQYCEDIQSFFGMGACFGISSRISSKKLINLDKKIEHQILRQYKEMLKVMDVQKIRNNNGNNNLPSDKHIKSNNPINSLSSGNIMWKHLTPESWNHSRYSDNLKRRLKGSGGGNCKNECKTVCTNTTFGGQRCGQQCTEKCDNAACWPKDGKVEILTSSKEGLLINTDGRIFYGSNSTENTIETKVINIKDLRPGDYVKSFVSSSNDVVNDVANPEGYSIVFEPVLAYLHTSERETQQFLRVEHEFGVTKVTPGHVVFVQDDIESTSDTTNTTFHHNKHYSLGYSLRDKPMSKVKVGEKFLLSPGEKFLLSAGEKILFRPGNSSLSRKPTIPQMVWSRVLSKSKFHERGFYSVLTASGTLFVDGVLYSNYGHPSDTMVVPHDWMHMSFAPLRLFYSIDYWLKKSYPAIYKILQEFSIFGTVHQLSQIIPVWYDSLHSVLTVGRGESSEWKSDYVSKLEDLRRESTSTVIPSASEILTEMATAARHSDHYTSYYLHPWARFLFNDLHVGICHLMGMVWNRDV